MTSTHIIPAVYDLMDLDERYGKWNENGLIELYRPGFNTQLDKIKFRSFSANIRSELQNMKSPEFVCSICAGVHYLGTGEIAQGLENDYKNYPGPQSLTITNKSGQHVFSPSNEYNQNGCKYIIESFKIPLNTSFDYSIERLMNYANGKIKSILGINEMDETRFATGESIMRTHVVILLYDSFIDYIYAPKILFENNLIYINYLYNDGYSDRTASYSSEYTDSTPASGEFNDFPLNNYGLYLMSPSYVNSVNYIGLQLSTTSAQYLWDLSETYTFQVPNLTSTQNSFFTVSGCIPITFDCKIHDDSTYFLISYITDNNTSETPGPETYKNRHQIQNGRTYYCQYYYKLAENRVILNLQTGHSFTGCWLISHALYKTGENGWGLCLLFVEDDWQTFYIYNESFGEIPPLMITPTSDNVTTYRSNYYKFPLFSIDWTADNLITILPQMYNLAPQNNCFFVLPFSEGRNFVIFYPHETKIYDYNSGPTYATFWPFGNYFVCTQKNESATLIKAGGLVQFLLTIAPASYTEWEAPPDFYDLTEIFRYPIGYTDVTEICRTTGVEPPFLCPLFDMTASSKTYNSYTIQTLEIGELKWLSDTIGTNSPKWWSVSDTHLNTCIFNVCNSSISLASANLTTPEINEKPATETEADDDKYYWWNDTHRTDAAAYPYTFATDSTNWREMFEYDGEKFSLIELPFTGSNYERFLLVFYVDFYTDPLVMEFDYNIQQPPIFWDNSDDIDTDKQIAEHLPNVYPVQKSLADFVKINDQTLFSRINTYLALQDTDLTLKLVSPLAHTQNNIVFYLNESSLIEFKEYETGPSEMKVDCLIVDAVGDILTPADAVKIYSNITISLDWQFY